MKPNAENEYNPDPAYMSDLVNSTGLTRGELAKLLGISDRSIRQWMSGDRRFSYMAQFCVECLVLSVD